MKRNGSSSFSAAGSYLIYFLVGLLVISSGASSFDGLRYNIPSLAGADDAMIKMIFTAFMVIGGVMLLIKGIQSLIGVGFLGVPCIITDIAYIGFTLFLMKDAAVGASLLLVFFIILSAVSLIMNIVSLGGRR